jgi:hypothetical protein
MSVYVIHNSHNNHSAVYGLQLQRFVLDTHNIRIPSTQVTSHKEHSSMDVWSGHWTRICVVSWLHAQHAVIHPMSCRERKRGWQAVILGQEQPLHTHFPLDVWYTNIESTMNICERFLSSIQNKISFSWPFTHILMELCISVTTTNTMHINITFFWYDISIKFLSSIKYALHQV